MAQTASLVPLSLLPVPLLHGYLFMFLAAVRLHLGWTPVDLAPGLHNCRSSSVND